MEFQYLQADGRRWALRADDVRAYAIRSALAEVMGLHDSDGNIDIEPSLAVSEKGV